METTPYHVKDPCNPYTDTPASKDSPPAPSPFTVAILESGKAADDWIAGMIQVQWNRLP